MLDTVVWWFQALPHHCTDVNAGSDEDPDLLGTSARNTNPSAKGTAAVRAEAAKQLGPAGLQHLISKVQQIYAQVRLETACSYVRSGSTSLSRCLIASSIANGSYQYMAQPVGSVNSPHGKQLSTPAVLAISVLQASVPHSEAYPFSHTLLHVAIQFK